MMDDELDGLLAREPHREDDGFSARVLEALPPPRRRRRWVRNAILLGSGVLGVSACWLLPGAREMLEHLSVVRYESGAFTLPTALSLLGAASVAVWAALNA